MAIESNLHLLHHDCIAFATVRRNDSSYRCLEQILSKTDQSVRFALKPKVETEDIQLLQNDHPLYKLALELGGTETQKATIPVAIVKANVLERIQIELDQINVVDGTGKN
ncbi:hypothetical protein SAMN05192569_101414 [Parageobacillus thermantarcticus]|uniref:Uncharacterized protein n=1 Tax=Parageobacillus thermantarcticus TaxID=186116 RepID=A0A1I0T696_9BACL|nr:hypothetical protein [Parageobacillus thermantarcticus]SFA47207.1 hypothetical protein SAMN05192569_101414 [Parageobacillus thermantarcticus]